MLVDATKLSSSAAASMPVWPIKSRTMAGADSVRCLRLSLSGSTRECLPWMWSMQRSVSVVSPSSSGSGVFASAARRASSGKTAFKNRPCRGCGTSSRAVVNVLIDHPARRRAYGLDHGMIGRGRDRHFGIGALEGLGPDPAQSASRAWGYAGSKAISRIL